MESSVDTKPQFCYLLFIAIFIFSAYTNTANAQWTRISPGGGGAFTSIGVGPTGLVVATSDLGGAYISRDDGISWEPIGANKGITTTHLQSVAFHPTDDNILLLSGDIGTAANESGISRSEDKGNSFTPVQFTGQRSISQSIKSIAFAPSEPSIVYASVRTRPDVADSRIYRSSDAGKSFVPTQATFPGSPAIIKLAVHPTIPRIVLALSRPDRFATSATTALYLSEDFGNSWVEIGTEFNDISDVVFHPASPFPVYLADIDRENGGYYYKRDITDTNLWIRISGSIDNDGILWPVPDDALDVRVVGTSVRWSDTDRPVAWRISSQSGAVTSWRTEPIATAQQWTGADVNNWEAGWSKIDSIFNPPLRGEVPKSMGFDLSYKSNPDRIFSVNAQFANKGNFSESSTPKLDFVPAFTKEKTPGSNLWKSTGIDNITATLIEANASDPNTVYIGLPDLGCFVSRDAGEYWQACNYKHFDGQPWQGIDGKVYGGSVYALLSDPANAARVWMAAAPGQRNINNPDGSVKLLYSNNYGASWTEAAGIPGSDDIYGLSLDPTDPNHNRLYVTVEGQIYRTTDGGKNWGLYGSNCGAGCRTTAVDQGGNIYAGGESGLFYRPIAGTGWSRILNTFTGGIGDFNVRSWKGVGSIRPELKQSGDVFVSVFQASENNTDNRGGIYRCRPAGSGTTPPTCTQILGQPSTTMTAPYMRGVAVSPIDSNTIYATSSSAYTNGGYNEDSLGVLRSTNGGQTWSKVNTGMEWPLAVPISISPANPNVVYIGSPGPGYYKRDFASDGTVGITSANTTLVFWRNTGSGQNGLYGMNGPQVAVTAGLSSLSDQNWKMVGASDFNGDGWKDVFLRNLATGENLMYLMNGSTIQSSATVSVVDTNWEVKATGDLDSDGNADVIWRHALTGEVGTYLMNGNQIKAIHSISVVGDLSWEINEMGDIDGDGKADVIWRNKATGEVGTYLMNGHQIKAIHSIFLAGDMNWQIRGVGDLDGDNKADIVWRNGVTGENWLFQMNGHLIVNSQPIMPVSDNQWDIVSTEDYDRDGKDDLFWRNKTTGQNWMFLMSGNAVSHNQEVNSLSADWIIAD